MGAPAFSFSLWVSVLLLRPDGVQYLMYVEMILY